MDYAANLAFFLLEKTGSVLGKWHGKMSAKDQRALFGRFIGKGTIMIDGVQETVLNRVSACFGLDYDDRNVTQWRNLTVSCVDKEKQAVRNLVMSGARVELGKADAKHAYQVGVSLIGALDVVSSVQVNATNRNQACSIAEAYGFNVRDVNMIG